MFLDQQAMCKEIHGHGLIRDIYRLMTCIENHTQYLIMWEASSVPPQGI